MHRFSEVFIYFSLSYLSVFVSSGLFTLHMLRGIGWDGVDIQTFIPVLVIRFVPNTIRYDTIRYDTLAVLIEMYLPPSLTIELFDSLLLSWVESVRE